MTNSTAHTMPRQQKITIGLMLCLILGLGYWWYSTLEWEEKEIDLGYSKAAKQNDFLAAEMFLRKQGVAAITVKNLSLLDKHSWRNLKLGAQDTIILINGYKTLTAERYDSLYEWIENGGTLITSTQNPFIGTHTDEHDLLLDYFNIQPGYVEHKQDTRDPFERFADELEKSTDEHAKKSQTPPTKTVQDFDETTAKQKKDDDKKPDNYYRCGLDEEPTRIDFHNQKKPLQFDFSSSTPFVYYEYVARNHTDKDAQDESDQDDYQRQEKEQHLMYFDLGQGGVTITSDNHIWSNRRIDCRDHAFALFQLVNPEGRVWFLINQDAPSLAAILWRNAHYGVIAGLLALAFWIWAKSQRFGPILVTQQAGRRSLAEHIYASAMLLWRQQQHPQLLMLLREEILARLDEQHPHLDQGSGETRLDFLHQLTGIERAAIKQALFANGLQHPQEFATAIAHLQTISKQLSGNHF